MSNALIAPSHLHATNSILYVQLISLVRTPHSQTTLGGRYSSMQRGHRGKKGRRDCSHIFLDIL